MTELNIDEIAEVNGGAIPLVVGAKIAFNLLGGITGAYALGKTFGSFLK